MIVTRRASKIGPNFEVRIRSETLACCGEVVRQQIGTLRSVPYSSGVFIRDVSFTKKLLQLFVEGYRHDLLDDAERQELWDRVLRLRRKLGLYSGFQQH
jgi:hypothetical protein